MEAEGLVREGRLDEALQSLQDAIRSDAANAKYRVFLFQLLAILGQWDRAHNQLKVASELDPANLLMAQACHAALTCEALRREVFAGRRVPLVFGEPADWIGMMVQANQMFAGGKAAASQDLRARALELAPAGAGTVDGEAFEWVADADTRLGPLLEAYIEGKYYWVPFERVASLSIEAPTDLRDLVWAPATFTWSNGGQVVGMIPARYPDSESSEDPTIRMARRTEWSDAGSEVFTGLGQRLLATDTGEYAILEIRELTLGTQDERGGDG